VGTLTEIYDRKVATGEIRSDARQRAALLSLERVLAEVTAPAGRRGLGRLLGRGAGAPSAAPRGLYLWGGVGRGKSMLMDLFFDALPVAEKRRVHFHGFMRDVHAALERMRARQVADALRPVAARMAKNLKVLCLDEMEIEDIADAMIVGRLFERLLADGVTVVTTSNRPPEGLYKDGLNRQLFLPFIALLRDRLEVLELDGGDDYRRAADRGHPAYFTPLGAEASARMDALWTRVAGRHGDPLDIDVLGRTIRVSRHVDGIGRSDFWDLCGRPLGAADYLALAERHRIFFIDAVPRLSRANFNEARRFVTLVDALYDARIPLAVSAADRPERLYVEGEGSFAFARTASRLHEMTGAFWEAVPAGA